MSDNQPVQTQAAPAGEEIHLPGPSAIPLFTAIAITLVVIGLGLSLVISAIGAVLLVICIVRWISDTRRDIAHLPEASLPD